MEKKRTYGIDGRWIRIFRFGLDRLVKVEVLPTIKQVERL